jgi:hypothetical protein
MDRLHVTYGIRYFIQSGIQYITHDITLPFRAPYCVHNIEYTAQRRIHERSSTIDAFCKFSHGIASRLGRARGSGCTDFSLYLRGVYAVLRLTGKTSNEVDSGLGSRGARWQGARARAPRSTSSSLVVVELSQLTCCAIDATMERGPRVVVQYGRIVR